MRGCYVIHFFIVRGVTVSATPPAALAQSVERLPRNEKVDSSILSSGSEALSFSRGFLFTWGQSPAGEGLRGVNPAGLSLARVSSIARVAKLVDAQDLGSCDFGRVGSSPILRTQHTSPSQQVMGNLLHRIGHRPEYHTELARHFRHIALETLLELEHTMPLRIRIIKNAINSVEVI